MPTVLRVGPHRFFFYSGDGHEPPHIHLVRDDAKAKFWLGPVAFATASGFSSHDLLHIHGLIVSHQALLLTAWNDYFGR